MKEYDVTIKKYSSIVVEAETEEEAKRKVGKMLKPGENIAFAEEIEEVKSGDISKEHKNK